VFVDFGAVTYGVDLAVLLAENVERLADGRIHGSPDLILEVLSDSSVDRDRVEKFDAYRRYEVPWYWIGDPVAGTLEEYQWTPAGYLRTASGTLTRPFAPQAFSDLVLNLTDLMED
jgi:Uma2 family endonuclease